MAAYYNEWEPYAAQWLRNLIAAGHIAPGDVDERSIVDVRADDLRGYTQCHFFAGIGGWSHALRLAGWDDVRPVWTGSCPCQPFSTAGNKAAQQDERHLWPHWSRLIRESKPTVVFGEQVASAITAGWLDDVLHEMEKEGYACASAVLPACSVGAPHRRDRVWFLAHAKGADAGWMCSRATQEFARPERNSEAVPDPTSVRPSGPRESEQSMCAAEAADREAAFTEPGGGYGFWATEPDVGRVAHGVPARVGRLCALGNAIVPQVAAEFIKASM